MVSGGTATFLHLGGWGQAGLGGHGRVHGHVSDGGHGRAGGVGGSDEDLVQVSQCHQQVLPRRLLPVWPLPVLLWERGVSRGHTGKGGHQGQRLPTPSYLPKNDLEGLGGPRGQVRLVGHQCDVIALRTRGPRGSGGAGVTWCALSHPSQHPLTVIWTSASGWGAPCAPGV